jgi:hypothetical protein
MTQPILAYFAYFFNGKWPILAYFIGCFLGSCPKNACVLVLFFKFFLGQNFSIFGALF